MTPEDREMLEMAAKAAGILVEDYKGHMAIVESDGESSWRTGEYWSPLEDDGDALRLAVKLRLTLMLELPRIGIGPRLDGPEIYLEEGEDECAALRLAIVRAAAAIGKAMP